MIKKLYIHLTRSFILNMCTYMAPSSLDVCQYIMVVEVPKIGKEAVDKAIKECGQSKFKITHFVFYSCSGDMPGLDKWIIIIISQIEINMSSYMWLKV
ncbi:hypothetical protein K1719_039091 [Acacia pycnantha]|nr:hypothetical protein K1719_039091 [Acacia pycnantha]